MTNDQINDIINKHLVDFWAVQRLKVPIELRPYIFRMIKEATADPDPMRLRSFVSIGEYQDLKDELERVKGKLGAPKFDLIDARGWADLGGNWPEDFKLENGNYLNNCIKCKNKFIGYKYRLVCKLCT